MLFKTKNNIFYLCLLLISLRLVGCASVTEDTQGQTKEAKEQAPIVDLNAPTVIPEAVPKLEPENDPENEELQTEGEKQTIPPVAQRLKSPLVVSVWSLRYTARLQ